MNLFKEDFFSQKWDVFLLEWMQGSADKKTLHEFKQILAYDSKFRENFCDWIKLQRKREGQ